MKQRIRTDAISCIHFAGNEFKDNLPLLLETVAAWLRDTETVVWELTIDDDPRFEPDALMWSARVYVWEPKWDGT